MLYVLSVTFPYISSVELFGGPKIVLIYVFMSSMEYKYIQSNCSLFQYK